ncbi:hypothetical protein EYF80_027416 [Liparis tanakae]|uniref:Uncharacterized protein n=1 Tax=Liparis tanakae TaxID=230148 RepID=A0A4Z2HAX2_9TELE|nr:hypothetical protein EYF80_027416 [Liparis tanakae]
MASVKEKAPRVRHPTCEKDPGPEDEGPTECTSCYPCLAAPAAGVSEAFDGGSVACGVGVRALPGRRFQNPVCIVAAEAEEVVTLLHSVFVFLFYRSTAEATGLSACC